MENRIPLPTDNIFKFYALFGLLLFIFSCSSTLYVTRSANDVVFSALPELESLKQIEKPTPAETVRIALLQRKLEITKSDKNFFVNSLGVFAGVAFLLMVVGFRKWHTGLQPVLDRTAKVQLEIAELQLGKLQRELAAEQKAAEECAQDKAKADI